MGKIEIKANAYIYPMPAVIIGANVDNKANFLTVAYCAAVEVEPPMIAISLGKNHHSNEGIKKNGTFSVNIPSADMVEVTDYVGIYSGKKVDKSKLFDVFYGVLETAPMINEAPLNHECKLVKIIDELRTSEIFLGEIVKTYINEECLTNKGPDIKKLDPIIFSVYDNNYWKVGEHLGKAWKVGRKYEKK